MKKAFVFIVLLSLLTGITASIADEWYCPVCGCKNDGRFCVECDYLKTRVNVICPICGEENSCDHGYRFCAYCGSDIKYVLQQTPVKGNDVLIELRISSEEARNGFTKSFQKEIITVCEGCNGSGARQGTAPLICQVCNGTGHTSQSDSQPIVPQTCPFCDGTGKIIENPCEICNGRGLAPKIRTVTLQIAAGIKDGQTILMEKCGNSGLHGGENGDIYILISVKPD